MYTGEGTVQFSKLQDGTKDDIEFMASEYKRICSPAEMTNRVLGLLRSQKGVYGGAKIDMYEHGVQSATRAYRDGADEEMIACALLHDVGEFLSPSNHGEIIAAILRPYISEKAWFILAHHEIFQGYYYYHLLGANRNTRDRYKDQPFYQATVDFCEKWDAPSFDPDYQSLSIDVFEPMVLKLFSRKPYFNDPTHPKAVAVFGKHD